MNQPEWKEECRALPPPSLQTIRSSQSWSGQWQTSWCYFRCHLVREDDFNVPSISAKMLGPQGLLKGLLIRPLMIRGCEAGNPPEEPPFRVFLSHISVWSLHQVCFYMPHSLAHGVSINSQLCSQVFPTSHPLSISRTPGCEESTGYFLAWFQRLGLFLAVASGQAEKTLRGIKWERREMKLPSTYRVTIPYRIQQLIFKNKRKNGTHRWLQDTGPVENSKFSLMKEYKIEKRVEKSGFIFM